MEHLGFTCDHTDVKNAEKTGEPFCKDCWTRLVQIKAPIFDFRGRVTKPGEYWPFETFLDKIYKFERKKTEKARVQDQVTVLEDTTT